MKMSGLAQQDGHRRRHFPRYGITGSACAPSRNTKTRNFSEIRNQFPLCAYVALRTRPKRSVGIPPDPTSQRESAHRVTALRGH